LPIKTKFKNPTGEIPVCETGKIKIPVCGMEKKSPYVNSIRNVIGVHSSKLSFIYMQTKPA